MSDNVTGRIHTFIADDLLMGQGVDFNDEDPLLEEGIIDSMGIVELVGFLEDEFDLSLSDDEITDENLGSPGAIGRFVAAKRSRGSATRTSA